MHVSSTLIRRGKEEDYICSNIGTDPPSCQMHIINKSISTCTSVKGCVWFSCVSKLDFLLILHGSFSPFYGYYMAVSSVFYHSGKQMVYILRL